MKRRLALMTALLGLPLPALAHPHIFAEARLEVISDDKGTISELRNVWRFDDIFSSSVLMDFDKNGDLELDHGELNEIAETIRTSIADYGFFTSISSNGQSVAVARPEVFHVDFKEHQLLVFFIAKPEKTLPLKGKVTIGVYDPTMYTAIDFAKDEDMATEGDGFKACKRAVIRPDPDEVLAQNQASLTEAFFDDPAGTDMSKLFATRLELTC
ncbi:MAG: DUF1007 family protein [Allorhizobium sp.]